ncbi:MAG: glucosaminidase domain-containing protein [Bacteroidales bacterium]|nr:glucosaminidase domain-containing protein [Bacteroidales bacterium]
MLWLCISSLHAQYTENDIYIYIEKYHSLAEQKMQTHGIPASITLAQGILESAAGTSDLAVKANNHFGIKCHSQWQGERYYKTDDAENECFRKYKSVEESYNDHSDFLKAKRYERLFSLPPADYKGWAEGLKACGYATNPKYPERLITLIEKYRLDTFDHSGGTYTSPVAPVFVLDTSRSGMPKAVSYPYTKRTVYANNGSYFVVAQKGDSYLNIAIDVQQPLFRIRKYNDLLTNRYEPVEGEWVYIEKKPKFSADYREHVVVSDTETLRDICQRYGCKMSSIMTINQLERNTLLKKGQVILLQRNTH